MIEVRALSKTYPAAAGSRLPPVVALRGLSFYAPDGCITGLLGPNGAGKTTTLRILAGLERADAGSARVGDGGDLPLQARLGLFTDGCGLYGRLTGFENIAYHGRLHGLSKADIHQRMAALAGPLGLAALLPRRASSYSQGERMLVALARAIVHAPRHIVLDEPTSGLDVAAVRRLRDFLRHLASPEGGGHCVLVSSHVMDEIARLADRVVIMAQGAALAAGSVADIIARSGAPTFEEAFVQLAFGERE